MIYLPRLILTAIRLNIVIGKGVAFAIDIVFMNNPRIVVRRICFVERMRLRRMFFLAEQGSPYERRSEAWYDCVSLC